jgi:hypothetical protein
LKLEGVGITAKTILSGVDAIDLVEAETFIIEAGNESRLKEAVPKGKKWHIIINVSIEETDA